MAIVNRVALGEKEVQVSGTSDNIYVQAVTGSFEGRLQWRA